ncbi:MAG: TspO/MBR family protein [Bacteroidota bacterium]
MKFKDFTELIICLVIPLSIGSISGFATSSAITNWYAGLIKPSFNPPNYLFAPVWTALYFLMGVSLYIISRSGSDELRSKAILVFFIQLFLNFWWSIFFFSFERPDVALAEIVLLWLSIVYMIYTFRKINSVAAYLQIPYLLWVSFAAVLNQSIWWLNR